MMMIDEQTYYPLAVKFMQSFLGLVYLLGIHIHRISFMERKIREMCSVTSKYTYIIFGLRVPFIFLRQF